MKIAITGGSGFIGTRLCHELEAAGHACVIVDLKHKTPVDILDLPALEKVIAGCEVIYHLAAEHRDDIFPRSRYYEVNVIGTQNVMRAADRNNIKHIIFTSSFAVYGLDSEIPQTEMSEPEPFNDYGKSKLEAEEQLLDWVSARNQTTKVTIVRPVVVFGEGNRGNVHTLINQVASNRFLMIGSGENRKSMAYVGNVVAFLIRCLEEQKNVQIYNYADKPDYSMNELMGLIYNKLDRSRPTGKLPFVIGLGAGYVFDFLSAITGRTFPVSAVRIRKFCATTTSDARKSRTTFTPPYTLEQGLERMIEHDFAKHKAQSVSS